MSDKHGLEVFQILILPPFLKNSYTSLITRIKEIGETLVGIMEKVKIGVKVDLVSQNKPKKSE